MHRMQNLLVQINVCHCQSIESATGYVMNDGLRWVLKMLLDIVQTDGNGGARCAKFQLSLWNAGTNNKLVANRDEYLTCFLRS